MLSLTSSTWSRSGESWHKLNRVAALWGLQADEVANRKGMLDPVRAFATCLLALIPSGAFSPLGLGAKSLIHNPALIQSHSGAIHMQVSDSAVQNATKKVRESGMPPMEYWETLFDTEATLDRLGLLPGVHSKVVEFGCGYGTFSLPVARRVLELKTFDIDRGMAELTDSRATATGLMNICTVVRDVVSDGYGLSLRSCDAVLLFNILHCDEPVPMLREAASLLCPGTGRLYATHWRHDSSTPRGPPLDIRPHPEQLEQWALATGLLRTLRGPIDCPPWHYGWVFERV